MKKVCIGFGSNLGDSLSILQSAWNLLGENQEIWQVIFSSPYRTEPVGMNSDNWFVNAAGIFETSLQPHDLLTVLLEIEAHFGRVRREDVSGYQDRVLDLDLLMFEDLICDTSDLTIPHPHLHKRLFVLAPLAEIAPQYSHPVKRLSIGELFVKLQNKEINSVVEKICWPEPCYP